jgi:amidophosphoribosyltransferase
MNGLAGIIFGKKRRRAEELEYLVWLFARLLVLSEDLGPNSTGTVYLKINGSYQLFKRPIRANLMVQENKFREILANIDKTTTIIMGHTRRRTDFTEESSNRNNQPIRAGIIIGTHTGIFYNAEDIFARLDLPRFAETDSELLFRLADRFAPDGSIELPNLKRALALCRGQMSAVLVSRLDPGTIIVLKGNKPLSLRTHRKYRVVAFASAPEILDEAFDGEKGWYDLEVQPMTILTFHHEDIQAMVAEPFRFIPEDRLKDYE